MSSRQQYKATKLPTYVFDEAELAKARIVMDVKRLKEKLPAQVLQPTSCPICKSEMKGVEVRAKVAYYHCPDCGYKQPSINVDVGGNDVAAVASALGLGVLFGLGIAALLYLLSQK
mgnify:CR=1 FL=1